MRIAKWVLSAGLGTLLCAGGVARAQPVPYQGLAHTALGGAQLTLDPATGELFLSNIGSSGQDGVAVALPRVPRHTSTWTDYNVNDPGLSGRVESTVDLADGTNGVGPSLEVAGAAGNIIEITGFNGHVIGNGARLTAFQNGLPTATFDLAAGDVIQFSADTSVSTGGEGPIESIIAAIDYEPDAIGIRFGDSETGRLGVFGDTVQVADADALELRVVGMDLPPDAGLGEIRFFPGETNAITQPLLIIAECIEGEALAATGRGDVVFEDLNANGAPTDGTCPSCRLTLSNIGASGEDGALLEPSSSYIAARQRPASGGDYTFVGRPGGSDGLEIPPGGSLTLTQLVRIAGISAPGPVAPSQEIVFDNTPGARAIQLIDRQPFGGGISGSAGTTTLELLRSGEVVQSHEVGISNLTIDLLDGSDTLEISRSRFDSNLAIGGSGGADETTQHSFIRPITVTFGGGPAVEIDSLRILRDWVSGRFFSYEGAIVEGANLPDGISFDTGATGPRPARNGGIPGVSLREAILTTDSEAPHDVGDNVGLLLRGIDREEVERGGGVRFDLGSVTGAGGTVQGLVGARARLILLDEPAATEPIASIEFDPAANAGMGGGILNVGGDLIIDRVIIRTRLAGVGVDQVVIESPVFPLDLGTIPIGTPDLADFDFNFKTIEDPGGGTSLGASAWFYWELPRQTALPGGELSLTDDLTIDLIQSPGSPSSFDRYANMETSFFPDGRNPQTGEPVIFKPKLLAHEITHVAQGGVLLSGTNEQEAILVSNVGASGRDGVDLDLANSPAIMSLPSQSISSAEIDLALPSSGVPYDPFPGPIGSALRVEWTNRTTELRGFGTFSVKKRDARAEITLDDLAETPAAVAVTTWVDDLPVGTYTVTEPPYTAILEPGTLIADPPEFWGWSVGSSVAPLIRSPDDGVAMILQLPIDFVVSSPDGTSQFIGNQVSFSYAIPDGGEIESARILGTNFGELRVDDTLLLPEPGLGVGLALGTMALCGLADRTRSRTTIPKRSVSHASGTDQPRR